MNCKTCGYRLWNLPPGACPECGAPFKPSDFDFRRDAVQYVCPKCTQVYYGTDETGHLVPPEFVCVRCSEPMQMDRMIVRPAGGVEEERTPMDRNPWADRGRIGFLKGWFATIGHAMVLPHRLIGSTDAAGGTGDALSFTLLTQAVYHFVGIFPIVALLAGIAVATGSRGAGMEPVWIFGSLLLGALIGTLVAIAVWGLTIHGFLRLTGGTTHGLGRTYQCLGYSSAANCFVVIPCLGQYFAWIGWGWWIVSAIVMLVKGQGVGAGRAVVSVLLLPALIFIGLAGWIGWLVYEEARSGVNVATSTNLLSETEALATELTHTYAPTHGGRGPTHATELLVGHAWMSGYDFILDSTATLAEDVPLPGSDLEAFDAAAPAEQAALAQAAAAALPPSVVAHRVGDFVFTYHGFSLSPPTDPRLWTVIESPDPTANPGWTPTGTVAVATADGLAAEIPSADFASQLQQQNSVRAQHHLPPLPDPATVTHAQPATAP